MRQVENSMNLNNSFNNSLVNNNARFSSLEMNNAARFNALDNKIDNLERDLLSQKIADLRDDKILAGQTTNRLQAEVNSFCCPKPSARYEVVGCGNQNGSNGGITINEVVNVVQSMMGNRNLSPNC